MTWRKYDPSCPPQAGQRVRFDGGAECKCSKGSQLNTGDPGAYQKDKWEVFWEPTNRPPIGTYVKCPPWCTMPEWAGAFGKVVSHHENGYEAAIDWIGYPKGRPARDWDFPQSNLVVIDLPPAPKEGDRVRCTRDIATVPIGSPGIFVGTLYNGNLKVRFDNHTYTNADCYHICGIEHLEIVSPEKEQFKVGDRVRWANPPLDGNVWVGTIIERTGVRARIRYDHYNYITPDEAHSHHINDLEHTTENKTMGTPIAVGQVWKDGRDYTVKVVKIYDGVVDAEVISGGGTLRKKGDIVVRFGLTEPGGKTCNWIGWKVMPIKVEVGQIWQMGDWKVKITRIDTTSASSAYGDVVRAVNVGRANGYEDGQDLGLFAYLKKDGSGTFSDLDHWTMIEDVKKEEQMSEDKKSGEKAGFVETFKQDAAKAAWRSAGTQLTNGVQAGILLMLKDKGADESKIAFVKEMMATEFGAILIRASLGYGLTYMPMVSEDPRVQKLAEEFRVSAIDSGMEQVMGGVMQYLAPAVMQAVAALPPLETAIPNVLKGKKHRVASDADDVEEETEEETPASAATAG